MNLLDVLGIGVALSMDACALTIANCTAYGKALTGKKGLAMPLLFALFQGLMPLIGFFVGSLFAKYLSSIGGYLTAAVFYVLCGKIIFDIVKDYREAKEFDLNGKSERTDSQKKNFSFAMLLVQAIATSIDALIVGVTLSFELTFSIWWAVLAISAVTFALVLLALLLGKSIGSLLGKYASWAGAAILFVLATKTLIEAII